MTNANWCVSLDIMKELIQALLTDRAGINEDAYIALCEVLSHMANIEAMDETQMRAVRQDALKLLEMVRGSAVEQDDGRYYFRSR